MGPKKGGVNEKVEAARDRKESVKKEASAKKAKSEEDNFWKEAGEGSKTKAAAKREEQEKQRVEAAKKKAEAKQLAEAEEAELARTKAKSAQKAPRVGHSKVTAYQLGQQKELEAKQRDDELRERDLAQKREVTEDSYSRLVETENVNRQDEGVEARSVEAALAALTVGAEPAVEKHPEKRMRSAWLAFEERTMVELKADKPGLKKSQYKEMCWKLWQKSPDNPLVQAAAAGSRG